MPPHREAQAVTQQADDATEPAGPRSRALTARRYVELLQERRKRQAAMASEPPATASEVETVILGALDEGSGKPGGWNVEGPMATGRDSWVFRAHTPLAEYPLAVKVFCSAVPGTRVGDRYRQLQRYHSGMADGRDTVPAPWAVLPAHRTLISEWIDEPMIATLLRKAGRRRERRAELLQAAGRWLGRFHEQGGISFAPLDPARLRWYVDRSLGGVEGAGYDAGDAVFRHGYATLVKHAGAFSQTPVGHTRCHADFTPTNLFHGPERTVGIDFAVRPKLPVSFDICRFLTATESSKPFWTRRSDLSPQGLERQDQAAFMTGYGRFDLPFDGRMFSYLHLAEVLRRYATRIGERPPRGLSIKHRVKLLRLRRMIGYAARHVEQGD